MRLRSLFFAAVLSFVVTGAANAQSDLCDGNEEVGAVAAGTWNIGQPLEDDWDFATANGCTAGGAADVDGIVCFTPENSCNVTASCVYVPPAGTMTVNVFQGTCSDTATAGSLTCLGSAQAETATTGVLALTGGLSYCFSCDSSVDVTSMDLTLTETDGVGTCGSLPVDLQSFEINE